LWGRDLSGSLQGAGGIGGLLAVSKDGAWYFPLFDNNGNVTAYVDESGSIVAEYAYDAFGRTIDQSGPLDGSFPHRFSTKYFDAKTGLYYYGYRFYLPELMRWLNRDPIEESSGVNLYTYIDNDSVNAADYVGLLKIWYDSTGKEICRTQKWWPFVVTKYIKGPNGNVNFNGNSYWQVWHHDNGYLPGTHSGINENWDVPMLQFVNSQKGLSFTAPSWYLPAMPGWIKSYDLVMANSPAGAAWDYKQFLTSDQWYVYKGKAFRFDSIGNITWGAIMKRYNWPRPVALIGAGLYQIKTDFDNKILTPWGLIYRLLQGTSGDDPRDQEAINEGYYF
jgi:RHS repeat-associated protein